MRQSMNQVIFAALLLFVGIFLLLLNVGVISLEIKVLIVELYPYIMFLFSFYLLVKAFKRHSRASLFWGIFFLSFSLMLCLDRFQIVNFSFGDFWKLWPVIIIYFGLELLIRKDKVKIFFNSDIPFESKNEETVDSQTWKADSKSSSGKKIRSFSIGDIEIKKSNWSLEPMNLYNTIGDYFIDFSKAYIPEKETPIIVQGWIGDVKMIVPDDVAVHVQAKVKIGDIRIFDIRSNDINRNLVYETPGYEDAIKKLNIMIELKIGSIRIDQV
ncbi:cell wall-active antibiotics response protein LiaF [Neobacillus sp. D3-1R]|uniref:cell wall-active antibiotics response protein LiaF n=1 Tax=Neobacillus sp. D3-1R TaxID=3445778 RepID=UPI003F9EF2C3